MMSSIKPRQALLAWSGGLYLGALPVRAWAHDAESVAPAESAEQPLAVQQDDPRPSPPPRRLRFGKRDHERFEAEQARLPFPIHPAKRLTEEDIEAKREGFFVTGLPEIDFNPVNGLGGGGAAYLHYNKDRSDPFFNYTPYRHRYAVDFRAYQNGRVEGGVGMDFPYLLDSKWRLRSDFVAESDPNFQYFGIGEQTMQPLRALDRATGQRRSFRRMNDYLDNNMIAREGDPARGEAGLVTDTHFNEIHFQEQLVDLLLERTFFGGRLRAMMGYELLFFQVRDYTGRPAHEAYDRMGRDLGAVPNGATRFFKDANGIDDDSWERLNISGADGGRINMLAFAVMWDTRDLEPDPSSGILVDYSHEWSHPILGSEFSFHKQLFQFETFTNLLPRRYRGLQRMVLATNVMLGNVFGSNIAWIELFDLSSRGEVSGTDVLGGPKSLRGYRQSRFMAPTILSSSLELRTRFTSFNVLGQHFALDVVPFFDFGRVWDRLRDFDLDVRFYRWSPGIGGRVAWNVSTIIRADVAFSQESTQFFFGLDHVF